MSHCHQDTCCKKEDHHSSCGCHKGSCEESHHHGHESCDFAKQLLSIADDAWMEVLKEKIRKQISETSGAHLDQLAKLVAEANNKRWQHKLGANQACEEYKEKISEFFHKK